jgi:hypothetical protein
VKLLHRRLESRPINPLCLSRALSDFAPATVNCPHPQVLSASLGLAGGPLRQPLATRMITTMRRGAYCGILALEGQSPPFDFRFAPCRVSSSV